MKLETINHLDNIIVKLSDLAFIHLKTQITRTEVPDLRGPAFVI